MTDWLDIAGLNQGYVASLYERYRRDPGGVDAATRAIFDRWAPPIDGLARPSTSSAGAGPAETREEPPAVLMAMVAAVNLAEAIRRYGHLASAIDPLADEARTDAVLQPDFYGLPSGGLGRLPAGLVGGPLAESARDAWEAIERLRRVYCSAIGYDYAHIFAGDERAWLHEAAETGRFRPPDDPIDAEAILVRLTEVEVFERFLHRTFPGRSRFSIEGLDMLVPILDEMIAEAAEEDIREILIGLGHRGRLNVLAHVLGKPYGQIFAEFKDPLPWRGPQRGSRAGVPWRHRPEPEDGWTGDVKYHKGAHRAIKGGAALDVHVSLPSNPSHLESIDPVVEGRARAAGTDVSQPGPGRFDPHRTLPILVHGDASFPGQGVAAETLNLSRLAGYTTGGTIHIITNNQLGFTATPGETRSTLYASALARGFKIPIVHVNADEPEACIEAARTAFAYRARFGRDFVIDLVGYRRYGHNEGDEPSFTQPQLYRKVADHRRVRELWATKLIDRGVVPEARPAELERAQMEKLQAVWASLQPERQLVEPQPKSVTLATVRQLPTGVPIERLGELHESLLQLPKGFRCHPKLEKARERRRQALAAGGRERTVDWATAEELAFASILSDGTAIRLTGQDVERGTFSQRHACFHEVETGDRFVPLQAIPQARAAFEIHNSALTENAVLAFEFGYNIQGPDRLVIWEAQYGDFVNLAQVVIDEFILSARDKWGQTPSLVLLLPHGYEGQGPDHASARPERFLQLAANVNVRVANCTTAAQYFHLLRRQAALLRDDPLPLVIFTPKSLLRHPITLSTLRELAEGRWQPVLDDSDARRRARDVTRLLLCTGKVYADLMAHVEDDPERARAVAICRIEQLYPVPEEELETLLAAYPALSEVIWVQEERENMGAWPFMRPILEELGRRGVPGRRWRLGWVARPPGASPAEGSAARHAESQRRIVEQALAREPAMASASEQGLQTRRVHP